MDGEDKEKIDGDFIATNVTKIGDIYIKDDYTKGVVDINLVKKYFTKCGFEALKKLIKVKNSSISYSCLKCKKELIDGEDDSVGCEKCFLWAHKLCVQFADTKQNKNNPWFCQVCSSH